MLKCRFQSFVNFFLLQPRKCIKNWPDFLFLSTKNRSNYLGALGFYCNFCVQIFFTDLIFRIVLPIFLNSRPHLIWLLFRSYLFFTIQRYFFTILLNICSYIFAETGGAKKRLVLRQSFFTLILKPSEKTVFTKQNSLSHAFFVHMRQFGFNFYFFLIIRIF